MKKIKTLFKYIPYLVIAILVGVTVAYAGNLTPPGAPIKTMATLTNLYDLVNTGANTVSPAQGTALVTPAYGESMYALGDIYNLLSDKIADIDGTQILTGTTIFGVPGSATEAVPVPTLTWQTPDPALALCWSNGAGCSVGSGFTQTPDTLTTLGAKEYCQYLNSDGTTLANTAQNIWHLPTIQEYTSITDYTKFGADGATAVTGFAGGSNYWSSTESAEEANVAWYWGSGFGSTNGDGKDGQGSVRCVR